MNTPHTRTLTLAETWNLGFPPTAVFPLLCPVREYDWIDGWQCTVRRSLSGVAEEDCVFETPTPEGQMTWVVTDYEPLRAIAFTCLVPDIYVVRLSLRLEGDGQGGSALQWMRRFVSIGEAGDAWVASVSTEAFAAKMAYLRAALEHYLKTGSRLPTGS